LPLTWRRSKRRTRPHRAGGPTKVHSWIGNIFAEFRELELRLLMGRLTDSLSAPAARRPRDARSAR